MRSLIGSHRGYGDDNQENTIPAFKAAIDVGVDLIEFDTHLTMDGEWIINHDTAYTDPDLLIKDLTLDEMYQLADEHDLRLDLLHEVLESITEIKLNIECKSENKEDGAKLARYLSSLDIDDFYERINVSSFHRPALRGYREVDPKMKISYLGYLLPFFRWQSFHKEIGLYSINPYIRFISARKARAAHSRGIQLHTWTANSEEEIMNCFKSNVDVLITDHPKRALKLRDDYYTD